MGFFYYDISRSPNGDASKNDFKRILMSNNLQSCFTVRSIYQSKTHSGSAFGFSYEERIVLFHAFSFDDAIAQAELEAKEYCQNIAAVALDYFMAYELEVGEYPPGVEIFSLIRDSNLSDNEYIDRFFDSGSERSQSHNL